MEKAATIQHFATGRVAQSAVLPFSLTAANLLIRKLFEIAHPFASNTGTFGPLSVNAPKYLHKTKHC